MHRREWLVALGVGATAGLAGCSGNGDDGDGTDPADDGTPSDGDDTQSDDDTGADDDPGGDDSDSIEEPPTNGDDDQPENGNGREYPTELDIELLLEPDETDPDLTDFFHNINLGLEGETGEYNPNVNIYRDEENLETLDPGAEWNPDGMGDYTLELEVDGEVLDQIALTRPEMVDFVNQEGNNERLRRAMQMAPTEGKEGRDKVGGTYLTDQRLMANLDPEEAEENIILVDRVLNSASKNGDYFILGATENLEDEFELELVEEDQDLKVGISDDTGLYILTGEFQEEYVVSSNQEDEIYELFDLLRGKTESVYEDGEVLPEQGLPSPVEEEEMVLTATIDRVGSISEFRRPTVKEYGDEDDIHMMIHSYEPEEDVVVEEVYEAVDGDWVKREGLSWPNPYEVNEALDSHRGI